MTQAGSSGEEKLARDGPSSSPSSARRTSSTRRPSRGGSRASRPPSATSRAAPLPDQAGERDLEARDQPVDGRAIIEIGGVFDLADQLAVFLLEADREIEFGRRRLQAHRPQPQVLDLQAPAGSVLQDKHHL